MDSKAESKYIKEIVMQLIRMPGGERAGDCGILELITTTKDAFYDKPGIHFIPANNVQYLNIDIDRSSDMYHNLI